MLSALTKIVVSSGLTASLLLSQVFQTSIVEAPTIDIQEVEQNEKEQRLEEIINHLSYCESRHSNSAYNPLDKTTPSYGRFQFKTATWHYYLAKYGYPTAQAAETIWDGEFQEEIVRKILQEPNGYKNWWACLHTIYEPNESI